MRNKGKRLLFTQETSKNAVSFRGVFIEKNKYTYQKIKAARCGQFF